MEEIEALLKQLGLTEYEAKALIVLLRNGKSTAERISSLGSIPLPRVYDTMTSLSERGVISISRTRPQTFKVINMKGFFDILKQDETSEYNERIKSINSIKTKFLKEVSKLPPVTEKEPEELLFGTVKRRANVGKVLEEIQDQTQKEFLVFAGDLSWIPSMSKIIRKTIKKGIKYKVIWCKPIKEVVPKVKRALRLGIELRCYPEKREFRGIVSDGKKVYIIQKTPKTNIKLKEGVHWTEEIANYKGITIDSKLIADVYRNYFNMLWKKAIPADKFLKKFK